MARNAMDNFSNNDNAVAVLGFHDGSAGQVETWFEKITGYRIACFILEASEPMYIDIDAENAKRVTKRMEYPTRTTFKGRPLVVSMSWVEELKKLGIKKVLPLTPNNMERFRQINLCRENGIELVSAIHPSVLIMEGVTIEPGVWINAGSIIGYKSEIKSGVIINTAVSIDHHAVIESCSQLDPRVVLAGYVTIRECSHVHTNATVINRVEIGEKSIIGAGSVVLKSIPPHSTAVGTPAKVIKKH